MKRQRRPEDLNTPALKAYKRHLERKFEVTYREMREFCTDPMNGCPGDFAEAYSHKLDMIALRLDQVHELLHERNETP